MPRVQCLFCGRILSRSKYKAYAGAVEYAYCERCYRDKVRRLESTLASYRAGATKHNEAQEKYRLDARRVEFLRDWSDLHREDSGGILRDVVLVPADGPPGISAHKAILAGRSPVFRAMFCSCPMREAESGVVVMDDMPREALAGFVGFFYTASVAPEVMRKHSALLLCAAEKYGVALLRAVCEDVIAGSVCRDNAIITLELARRYGSQAVRDAVLDAASQDVEHLPTYADYQAYANKDPALLLELYEGLIQRRLISRKRSRY